MLLFCYGSNHPDQLRRRIGVEVKPQAAVLENYTRIFTGYSSYWKGGVASLEKAAGQHVRGLLVYLNESDLNKLDAFETGYKRVRKYVTINHKRKLVYLYIKQDDIDVTKPSARYIKEIEKLSKLYTELAHKN
jgi:gamma-glutamylcyclotransferase (GGCT)/AIG2-like uncharacterized protein YtfP